MRIMLELNPSGWRCVGLVVANTHKAQERPLGGLVVANNSGETSVGTLQARGSHWNALKWSPGLTSKAVWMCPCGKAKGRGSALGYRGWVTTHGECVQPLQSVKLSWQSCSRLRAAWTLTWLVGILVSSGMVRLLGFPVGAGDSMGVIQLELDVLRSVVQLELDIRCCVV
jgi:hypothetical protein